MALDGGSLEAEATLDIRQVEDAAKRLVELYGSVGKAAGAVPPLKVEIDKGAQQAAQQAGRVIQGLVKDIQAVPPTKLAVDTTQAQAQVKSFAQTVSQAKNAAVITPKIDESGLKQQVTSIKGFLQEAFSSFGGVANIAPSTGGLLGILGAGGLAAGVGVASAALLTMGQEARAARKELQNMTGATGPELNDLVAHFHELAANVPESGTAVARLTATLKQQLHETNDEINTSSTAILQLTRVIGGDLSENATAAAGVFKSFGVAAADQRDTLSALTAVTQTSGLSFGQLAQQVQEGAPLFKAIGLNAKEAGVFLGQLESAGVDTGQAMVALRQGIGSAAAAGTSAQHDFANLFSVIKNAPNEMTATAIAMENFGPRGGAALAQGIRAGTISIEELKRAAAELPDALETPLAKGETAGQKFEAQLNKIKEAMGPVAEGMATSASSFLSSLSDMGAGVDKFLQSPNTIKFIQLFMQGGAGAAVAAASFAGGAPAPPETPTLPEPLAAPRETRPLDAPVAQEDIDRIKDGTLAISDLVTSNNALSDSAQQAQQAVQGTTDAIAAQQDAATAAAAAHTAYVAGLESIAIKGVAAGDGIAGLLTKMHGDPDATEFLLDWAQKTQNVQTAITKLTDTGIAAYIAGLVAAAQQTEDMAEKQRLLAEAAGLADSHLQAQADTAARNTATAGVLSERYSQIASAVLPALTLAQSQMVASLQATNHPAEAAAAALRAMGASAEEADRVVQGTGQQIAEYTAKLQRLVATADPVAAAHKQIEDSARGTFSIINNGLTAAQQQWAQYRAAREGDAEVLKGLAANFGIDPEEVAAALQGTGQQLADFQDHLRKIVDSSDQVRAANNIIEDSAKSMLSTLEAGMSAAERAQIDYEAAVKGSAAALSKVYASMGGDVTAWANMTIQQQQRVVQSMAAAINASETFHSTGRLLPAQQQEDLLGPQHQQQVEDTARSQARQEHDLAVAAQRLAQDRQQQDIDAQRSAANIVATYDATLQSIQAAEQSAVTATVQAATQASADHYRTLNRQNEDFTRQQERLMRDQAQQDAETIRSFAESAGDLLAGATSSMNAAAGQAAQGLLGLSGGALAAGAAQLVDQFASARQDAQDTAEAINKAIEDSAQHLRESFQQTNQQASDTIKGIRDSLVQGSKDVVSVFGQTFVQVGKATEFGPSPEATAWAASQARDQKIIADNLAIAAQATQQQSILDTAAKARASIDADAAKTAQDLNKQILEIQKAAAKQRKEMIVQLIRMVQALQRAARDTLQSRADQHLDTDIQQQRQNEDQEREWMRQVRAMNAQIADAHNQAARARQQAREQRDRALEALREQERRQQLQRARQDEDLALQRQRLEEDRRVARERERREIARAREQVRQGDDLRRIAGVLERHPNAQLTVDMHDNALVDPAGQLMQRVSVRWRETVAAGAG